MELNWPASPSGRAAAVAAITGSLVIVAVAERDLHRRPQRRIRGNRRLWQLACMNALPASIYLRWGRK